MQEEDAGILLVATSFLLADARMTERTYEVLNKEGAFTRLVDLISSPKEDDEEGLHRLLMELLYEMSRIQKISLDDLGMLRPLPSAKFVPILMAQRMLETIAYGASSTS